MRLRSCSPRPPRPPRLAPAAVLAVTSQIAGCSGWGITGAVLGGIIGICVGVAGAVAAVNAHRRVGWRRQAFALFHHGDYRNAAPAFNACRRSSQVLPGRRANALAYAVYEAVCCRLVGRPELIDKKVAAELGAASNATDALLLSAALTTTPIGAVPSDEGCTDELDAMASVFVSSATAAARFPHNVTQRRFTAGAGEARLSIPMLVIAPERTHPHPDDDPDSTMAFLEDVLVRNGQIPWQRGDLRRILGGQSPHFRSP